MTKDKEYVDAADRVADLYQQAGRNPELGRAALRYTVNDYLTSQAGVRSAPQAAQVAGEASVRLQMLQVAQNQRIIDLLEN